MSTLPAGILKTKNGDYVLEQDTHLSRWVEQHGRLDIAWGEIQEVKKYIPLGGVVIDCGACLGDHSKTYSQLVGVDGCVLAFEPHPLTYKALCLNAANWFPINTRCYNVALGARPGVAYFLANENIGASQVWDKEKPQSIEVEVMTVDQVTETIGRLDFIHLDAEGFEPFILEGARKALAKFRPVLLIEINQPCLARLGKSESDVRAVLTDLKYEVREFNGTPEGNPQRDILCLPL